MDGQKRTKCFNSELYKLPPIFYFHFARTQKVAVYL